MSLNDPQPSMPVLELDGAEIGYDGRSVVRGVDLRLDSGDVVAILGANGSGKSTLVRGLFGLAHVYSGTIRLFGAERGRFREWRRIGYVPQTQTIRSGIPSTVREVVTSGRVSLLAPWRRQGGDDRRAVNRAIEAVGLASHDRTPVVKLSGGQQRRVLIARALATAPDLLVLDEPTAGVDAANQEALGRTLRELIAGGTTIVLVAHELGPVEPLISRVVLMRSGTIVFDGARSQAPPMDHGGDWHHPHGFEQPARPDLGLPG